MAQRSEFACHGLAVLVVLGAEGTADRRSPAASLSAVSWTGLSWRCASVPSAGAQPSFSFLWDQWLPSHWGCAPEPGFQGIPKAPGRWQAGFWNNCRNSWLPCPRRLGPPSSDYFRADKVVRTLVL